MTFSPVQFAKDFEKLRSDLQSQPAADLQLLALVDFWSRLRELAGDDSYQSYFDEYLPLLSHLVTEDNLTDMTIDELRRLAATLSEISQWWGANRTERETSSFRGSITIVSIKLATLHFYVGQVEEGYKSLAELVGEPPELPIDLKELEGLNEYEACRRLGEYVQTRNGKLGELLRDIDDTWEADRGAFYYDRANCLFVEKDGSGGSLRGRFGVLDGSVELAKTSAKTDEITFQNQIKSPDDPFIGVVYDSLQAVREIFRRNAMKERARSFYHAYFSIKDSKHTYTGDSIGLAIGLLAYVQLLQPEVLRLERFLSAEVAFTGGVDSDGKLTAVNDDTLHIKIKRAFFSPVKYLVLPELNHAAAKEHLAKLKAQYPRRHLLLIGAERLADVVEDHNVVRSEKVCIGEFVAKKAYGYGRMVKIQIPILIVLLYLLVCLLYPKAWLGFDWNPEYVKLTKTGFIALNGDLVSLWSVEYDCESLDSLSQWKVGDLDDDGENEVLFIPRAAKTHPCPSNAQLFVYDNQGEQLFQKPCAIIDEYPGDTTLQLPYTAGGINLFSVGERKVIVTRVYYDFPTRLHIKIWSEAGDSLGWYINSGYGGTGCDNCLTTKDDEYLLFISINNLMDGIGCACLFAIPIDSSYGVSPPYTGDFDGVTRGNQVSYVLFPCTDVCRATGCVYNVPYRIVIQSSDEIMVDIREGGDKGRPRLVSYYFNNDFRVTKVKADDYFLPCRDSLMEIGAIPQIDWDTYYDRLRNSVIYWTDSGWVTEGELRALEEKE